MQEAGSAKSTLCGDLARQSGRPSGVCSLGKLHQGSSMAGEGEGLTLPHQPQLAKVKSGCGGAQLALRTRPQCQRLALGVQVKKVWAPL